MIKNIKLEKRYLHRCTKNHATRLNTAHFGWFQVAKDDNPPVLHLFDWDVVDQATNNCPRRFFTYK